MRIGIIGSGRIGGTAARLFAGAGHEVAISHSGPPETLGDIVAGIGPLACSATVEEAAAFGDVVLLALPWRNRDRLPAQAFGGKIVVDATNPYAPDFSVYDLGGSTSSEEMASTLPGARIVKAFNTMFAGDLATLARRDAALEDRFALFLAGDDAAAKQTVADLIEGIGFAPVDTGSLREGGRRQEPGSPLYAKRLRLAEALETLAEMRDELRAARPEQPQA